MRFQIVPMSSPGYWHSWFAWYPVKCLRESNECYYWVWLERVKRTEMVGATLPQAYYYRTIDKK